VRRMFTDDPIPALKQNLGETIATLTREWSTGEAASLMCTDIWRVADIRAGRLERFSLETLIRFAFRLNCEVTINAERRRRRVAGKTNRPTGPPQR